MTPRNQETANIDQDRAARDPFRARATDPDAGDLDGSPGVDEPDLDEPRPWTSAGAADEHARQAWTTRARRARCRRPPPRHEDHGARR